MPSLSHLPMCCVVILVVCSTCFCICSCYYCSIKISSKLLTQQEKDLFNTRNKAGHMVVNCTKVGKGSLALGQTFNLGTSVCNIKKNENEIYGAVTHSTICLPWHTLELPSVEKVEKMFLFYIDQETRIKTCLNNTMHKNRALKNYEHICQYIQDTKFDTLPHSLFFSSVSVCITLLYMRFLENRILTYQKRISVFALLVAILCIFQNIITYLALSGLMVI